MQKQICQSVVAQIKYSLNCIEISKKNDSEAKATLNAALNSIDYDIIKQEQEVYFQAVLDSQDYSRVIKVFNEKNIAKSIGHYIGLQDKDYCITVIALLHSPCRNEIINALSSYLPTEIPR